MSIELITAGLLILTITVYVGIKLMNQIKRESDEEWENRQW